MTRKSNDWIEKRELKRFFSPDHHYPASLRDSTTTSHHDILIKSEKNS